MAGHCRALRGSPHRRGGPARRKWTTPALRYRCHPVQTGLRGAVSRTVADRRAEPASPFRVSAGSARRQWARTATRPDSAGGDQGPRLWRVEAPPGCPPATPIAPGTSRNGWVAAIASSRQASGTLLRGLLMALATSAAERGPERLFGAGHRHSAGRRNPEASGRGDIACGEGPGPGQAASEGCAKSSCRGPHRQGAGLGTRIIRVCARQAGHAARLRKRAPACRRRGTPHRQEGPGTRQGSSLPCPGSGSAPGSDGASRRPAGSGSRPARLCRSSVTCACAMAGHRLAVLPPPRSRLVTTSLSRRYLNCGAAA